MKITDYNNANVKNILKFQKVFNKRHPQFLEPVLKQRRFVLINSPAHEQEDTYTQERSGSVLPVESHKVGWKTSTAHHRHPLETRRDLNFCEYGQPKQILSGMAYANQEESYKSLYEDLYYFRGGWNSNCNMHASRAFDIREVRTIDISPETLREMLGTPTFSTYEETQDRDTYARYVFYDHFRRGIYFHVYDKQTEINRFCDEPTTCEVLADFRRKRVVLNEQSEKGEVAKFWELNAELPFQVALQFHIGEHTSNIQTARRWAAKLMTCYLDLFLVWLVKRLRPYYRSLHSNGVQQEFCLGGSEMYLNEHS